MYCRNVLFFTLLLGALGAHADVSITLPSEKLSLYDAGKEGCDLRDFSGPIGLTFKTIISSAPANYDGCKVMSAELEKAKYAKKPITIHTDAKGNLVSISQAPDKVPGTKLDFGSLENCKYVADEEGTSFSQKNCGTASIQVRRIECVDSAVGPVALQAACAVAGKEISADDCVTQPGALIKSAQQSKGGASSQGQGGVR